MDIGKHIRASIPPRFDPLIYTLERHGVSVMDLFVQESSGNLEPILKRIERPLKELEEFNIFLRQSLEESVQADDDAIDTDKRIPTGIEYLDKDLNGGIPIGSVTEIFGESGAGKSQFLYQVCRQSQKHERNRVVIINTEANLETKRLEQIVTPAGLLDNIDYIYCPDLEVQDHILFDQLPVKLGQDRSIQTVLIDSIGNHLREQESASTVSFLKNYILDQIAEDNNELIEENNKKFEEYLKVFFRTDKLYELRVNKKHYLQKLFRHLSRLAHEFNVAVVISNQIADQITNAEIEEVDPLDLDYQIGAITGWGNRQILDFQSQFESSYTSTKRHVPSLGYHWFKFIKNRLVLMKSYHPVFEDQDDLPKRRKIEGENSFERPASPVLSGWHIERDIKLLSEGQKYQLLLNNSGFSQCK